MKKADLPEGAEVARIQAGDTVIVKVAYPVPAETVAAMEADFRAKLPAGVNVIVVGPDAEITVQKGVAVEGQ